MGGVARALTWISIALGFLLVLSAVVTFAAYEDAKPYIEREYPSQLYGRVDDCSSPCGANGAREEFRVLDGMREVHFSVYVRLDAESGPIRIEVRDATGDVRYDRVFTGLQAFSALQDQATWSGEVGTWSLTRTYAGAKGTIDLQVWGQGLPPGTL